MKDYTQTKQKLLYFSIVNLAYWELQKIKKKTPKTVDH